MSREVLRALLKEAPIQNYVRPGDAGTLTVDEKTLRTLNQMHACFLSWEPQVCVMGNVRAEDGANALRAIIAQLRPAPTERARHAPPAKANPRLPEDFLVRFRGVTARHLWPAFSKFAPGITWSHRSKSQLANAWASAGTGWSAYKQLASVTLDMIEEQLHERAHRAAAR